MSFLGPLRSVNWRWAGIGAAILGLAIVASDVTWPDLVSSTRNLGPGAVAIAAVALILNTLGACVRMRVILVDFGFAVGWITAARAALYGTVAGALFFQLVGQVVTRAAVLRRAGVSPSATLVASLYERLISTLVLVSIAGIGAIYLFGFVSIDMRAGGFDLVRLCAGALAAGALGAAVGYPAIARSAIRHLRRRTVATRVTRAGLVTLAMQLMMLAAYVVLGRDIAPGAGYDELAAASAVVMLVAALPISFGGWGVRELSAVYAYGAIGVGVADALIIAVVLGAMSQVLALAGAGLASFGRRAQPATAGTGRELPMSTGVDHFALLAWAVPLAAATAVFFQVQIPVGGGAISANLADPIVVIGAIVCIAGWWNVRRSDQRWRLGRPLDVLIGMFTAAIALAFAHGALRDGVSDWALYNRFIGWFILLAYVLTGALITAQAGTRGQTTLLRTVVAVAAAMVISDFVFYALEFADVEWSKVPDRMEGMAANPNAFGFQMLIAASILLVLPRLVGGQRSGAILAAIPGLVIAAIWLSGSRASIGAFAIVALLAIVLGLGRLRTVVRLLCLAAVPVILFYVPEPGYVPDPSGGLRFFDPASEGATASDLERWGTIVDGLRMWLENPVFGAGLGAFHGGALEATGTPLVIHSTPVWLLAEFGVVGFLAVAVPACWVGWVLWRTWRADPRNPAIRIAILIAVVMLAEFLVHDMLYQRLFWLVLGACLAVPRLAAASRPGGGTTAKPGPVARPSGRLS